MKSEFNLRPAQLEDTTAIFELIKSLAEYEKLTHAVTGSVEALQEHLFGSHPYVEAIVAQCDEKAVGFALYFYNYSTFLTKPGIYLEDLFVLPDYRRQGIGKAIFKYLAELAVERDCGRLEWSVLDWNEPAIAFYRQIGAKILEDWQICRVTDTALTHLANSDPLL